MPEELRTGLSKQRKQKVQNVQKRQARRKHRRMYGLVVGIAVTVAAAAAVIAAHRMGAAAAIQARLDILPDRNAVDGQLHDREPVNVREGDYWVVVNQLPTIPEGSRRCNIEFENPRENSYASRISLYLKSTGKYLGGTTRVDPGKYVESVELNRTLEPGEYPVIAKIELFTGTEPAGELTLELTVRAVES